MNKVYTSPKQNFTSPVVVCTPLQVGSESWGHPAAGCGEVSDACLLFHLPCHCASKVAISIQHSSRNSHILRLYCANIVNTYPVTWAANKTRMFSEVLPNIMFDPKKCPSTILCQILTPLKQRKQCLNWTDLHLIKQVAHLQAILLSSLFRLQNHQNCYRSTTQKADSS